jgi:hypothetical protein
VHALRFPSCQRPVASKAEQVKFIIELIAVLVLYWTIRLAVRHGMQDAWKRRSRRETGRTGNGTSD